MLHLPSPAPAHTPPSPALPRARSLPRITARAYAAGRGARLGPLRQKGALRAMLPATAGASLLAPIFWCCDCWPRMATR